MNKDVEGFAGELFSMIPNLRLIDLPEELPESQHSKRNRGIIIYKIRKDYIQLTAELPSPGHEIAHMVEMQDFSRILMDDWGLVNGLESLSISGYFAALARESRVRGIQSHLDGRKSFNNEFWFLEKYLPFGKFENISEVKDWSNTIFQSARKSWNKERIRHEWIRRVEHIRNYQETKNAA